MQSECLDGVPSLFKRLHNRFSVLKSHLNNYILAIVRNSGDSFHFELASVSIITFCDDGFEVILRDSTSIYMKYSVIDELSLVRMESE